MDKGRFRLESPFLCNFYCYNARKTEMLHAKGRKKVVLRWFLEKYYYICSRKVFNR